MIFVVVIELFAGSVGSAANGGHKYYAYVIHNFKCKNMAFWSAMFSFCIFIIDRNNFCYIYLGVLVSPW